MLRPTTHRYTLAACGLDRRITGASALNQSLLLWGLLFGSLGLGFFVYGKRQKAVVPLLCGLALMIVPYFVSSSLLLVIVGSALVAVPYFVRL